MKHTAFSFLMFDYYGAYFFAALTLFFLFTITTSSYSATAGGLDTPEGVTSLPLLVQGQEGMQLVTTGSDTPPNAIIHGNVGIGTAAPAAALDVNGTIRPKGATLGATLGTQWIHCVPYETRAIFQNGAAA